jgi:hypothetical protein
MTHFFEARVLASQAISQEETLIKTVGIVVISAIH